MEHVKIELYPEKKDVVLKEVAKVISSSVPGSFFKEPIVGLRESDPRRVILIYESVNNAQEVALTAMFHGASMANVM